MSLRQRLKRLEHRSGARPLEPTMIHPYAEIFITSEMSAEEIEAARARMMEEYPARLFEKKVPAGTRVRFQLIYLQSFRAGVMAKRGDLLTADDEAGRGGSFFDDDDELGSDEDDD